MSGKHVIAKLGGVRAAARLLGRPPGTVGAWNVVDRIPAQHQAEVLHVARAHGIPLSPSDFFPLGDDSGRADVSSVSTLTDRPEVSA